ncbi:MAG: hypothetical protein ACTSR8_11345 [Promethearchaeota archaeon]
MTEIQKKNNLEVQSSDKNLKRLFFLLDITILVLSIAIPLTLVIINQYLYTCNHHNFNQLKGGAWGWIIGRSLGFTVVIWFGYTMIKGFSVKKNAKLVKDIKWAKRIHCKTALVTVGILYLHVLILVLTEPWRSIILQGRVKHLPYAYYLIKFWTGIIFGGIMITCVIFFLYIQNLKRLKKFGYRKFILVHRIMMICVILLVFHIIFINTEIWLATAAQNIHD